MSATAAAPLERDVRVISLIGVAHGASHYYQLAFVTMLLIVREKAGLSFTDVGALGAIYYAVSGICQTLAGFAVDRFGARPILAGGLALAAVGLALTALADSFLTFSAISVVGAIGNCVFHPADFAVLNSSVNHRRLGRAYSIHGLGGSLGWAAAPIIYFLDDLVGRTGAALIGAVPGLILAALVLSHRRYLVDHRVEVRAAAAADGAKAGLGLFLQASILLCFAYFALIAVNTVGIQQMAVPAWVEMFGITERYAALCLIVFMVGSAAGMLAGGFFADSVKRHDLVASGGLLVAAALTVPVAALAVTPAALLPLLALAGFAGGATNPSRDMIVRNATPPGASGKVFGFVYSGLDVGSLVGPPLFGYLMDLHLPAAIFWIAIGLYVVNAGVVLTIRQASAPRAVAAE
ncbi:MAG: MFS transporter [Reyranella sp.]|uniref:MFS transporter n=1 Tax=Reyranella sp. TaxID=1929291 RepID=UPI00121F8DA3|nr:MFS transporter [Reyranella sp.]TAJ42990.1 MAG: MFS transporter [Reyranella sp.]